jgi:hypothetical protein
VSRPYSYFVWANLAAFSFAVGPAFWAGVRRAVAVPRALPAAAALLVLAALAAVAVADLTGLSKAEVERIWLPFAVWLVVPCALLPRPRAQGVSEKPTPPGGGFSVRIQSMSEKPTPPGGGFSVRIWLAAQALLALAVNHLLLTVW